MWPKRSPIEDHSPLSGVSDPMWDHLYRLALSSLPGMGRPRLRSILSHCGGAESAYINIRDLPDFLVGGSDPGSRRSEWVKVVKGVDLQADAEKLRKLGLRLLKRGDVAYPLNLAATYDPPEILFIKGESDPQ